MLVESKHYLKGVDLLCKAITKIQQQPSQLLSIHSDLFKLCLLSKNIKPALQFLDVDISDISKEVYNDNNNNIFYNNFFIE